MTARRWQIVAVVLVALVVIGVVALVRSRRQETTVGPEPPSFPPIAERTKSEGCRVRGALPDPECSPGAVFAGVTKEQICTPGYAKSVRNVPTSLKNKVYAAYGITARKPGEYEMDHIVSLELGGSNDIANLYPQAAEPRPGFHEKDRFENYLHDQVCKGAISLDEAQRRIASDWLSFWIEAGRP